MSDLSSRRPLIGITMYGPEGEKPSFTLPVEYSDAVTRAGGMPVLLPANGAGAPELLDRLDGLILAGGGDIDPALHGSEGHATVYMVTPARDRFELALVGEALRRPELPLLGICRGMQVMNVALGGDLELHLPDVVGEHVSHRLPPREPTFHPVRVEPGSPLAEVYGTTDFPVCSWHHQGVRRCGKGLRPVAWAPDGVVEALVHERHPFAIGVQWHPEMQVAEDPLQRRLFEQLVERAGEVR